jgi:hypothetical protein
MAWSGAPVQTRHEPYCQSSHTVGRATSSWDGHLDKISASELYQSATATMPQLHM